MKKELTPALLAEFLIEHPECHDGVGVKADVGHGVEDVIDLHSVIKLTAFLVRKGMVSQKVGDGFITAVQNNLDNTEK